VARGDKKATEGKRAVAKRQRRKRGAERATKAATKGGEGGESGRRKENVRRGEARREKRGEVAGLLCGQPKDLSHQTRYNNHVGRSRSVSPRLLPKRIVSQVKGKENRKDNEDLARRSRARGLTYDDVWWEGRKSRRVLVWMENGVRELKEGLGVL
jgi:hypothetical protein